MRVLLLIAFDLFIPISSLSLICSFDSHLSSWRQESNFRSHHYLSDHIFFISSIEAALSFRLKINPLHIYLRYNPLSTLHPMICACMRLQFDRQKFRFEWSLYRLILKYNTFSLYLILLFNMDICRLWNIPVRSLMSFCPY